MQPQLKTGFWVSAYLRRLQLANIAVFVVKHGDDDAGVVLIKSNTLDGLARLMQRSYDISGVKVWTVLAEGMDAEIETAIARQASFDPDIWVLEVEDKAGRTFLDDTVFSG